MSANLATIMTSSAESGPDRPALKLDDTVVPYKALDAASARVGGMLKSKGVEPGDRVGIMLPNVPYFPIAYYGALRMGAVVVPMNVLLKARETGFYLTDPEAKVVIAWDGFAEAAEAGAEEAGAECILVKPGEFEKLLGEHEPLSEVAERDGSDTAVILYTSGTTGTPKGAELTHDNMRQNAEIALELFGIEGDAMTLGALPLFHSFGQTCGLNATMLAGGCLTLIPRFDPAKALEIIARDQVNIFEGVPTMFGAMLNDKSADGADTSSLKVCASGGSAMPVEVMKAFEGKFKCTVLEGYGLSETSPVASFNHPDRPAKPGSIGTPIRGVEMKLFDEDGKEVAEGEVGEIVIKGHNVMKGYWKREDATAEAIKDGWFYSGDLAKVDEDGFFFIVDRKKDMIIRGGYNVYPREVEEVLYEHPAVREAAVVAVPHPDLGEEVGAAVALKEGKEATAEELQKHVKDAVAAYKYPRLVWLVDDLPKGPTGKILKREIEVPSAEEGRRRDAPSVCHRPRDVTPEELVAAMPAARRDDVRRLDALVRATVPQLAPHVRDGMLGYGSYRYRYKSGRSGEAARIAVGANARQVSLHVAAMAGPEEYLVESFAERLGGGRAGRSCVRFSQLAALDLEAVRELLRQAAELPPPGLVEE